MQQLAKRGPGRPRDPEAADKKRRFMLNTAVKHFAKSGYVGTDVNQIADEIGCSKGSIYYYFTNKEQLFLAAVDWMMQGLLAEVEREMDKAKDPLQIVRDGVHAYLAYCDRHPAFVELLIQERSQFKDRKTPTYFEYKQANAGPWQSLYRALIQAGRVRPIPVRRIIDVICDVLYGTIFTNHFSGRPRSLKGQTRDIIDIVFNGILSDSERRSLEGAAS